MKGECRWQGVGKALKGAVLREPQDTSVLVWRPPQASVITNRAPVACGIPALEAWDVSQFEGIPAGAAVRFTEIRPGSLICEDKRVISQDPPALRRGCP